MNVRFIDAHRDRWAVAPICRVIGFSERTYYAARARPPSARDVSDEAAKVEIRRVWEANYQVYGARRQRLTARELPMRNETTTSPAGPASFSTRKCQVPSGMGHPSSPTVQLMRDRSAVHARPGPVGPVAIQRGTVIRGSCAEARSFAQRGALMR